MFVRLFVCLFVCFAACLFVLQFVAVLQAEKHFGKRLKDMATARHWQSVDHVFHQMKAAGIKPSEWHYTSALHLFSKCNMPYGVKKCPALLVDFVVLCCFVVLFCCFVLLFVCWFVGLLVLP